MPTANAAAIDVTPDLLFEIASGFMAAKHLFAANEIGLFTALADGSANLEELATATEVDPRRLRIVADAMVALGVLLRDGAEYRNGPEAAAFLSGRGPANLAPFLRFWDRLSYPTWTRFAEAVRTGQGQSTMHLPDEEQKIFSEGVAAIQAAPARALPEVYDFGQHRRVLDVGGGEGSWLVAILGQYPNLDATLFELPAAARVASEHFAAERLTKRTTVAEGDFFDDPLPAGHDVVLIANVLHLFSPERNLEILRRTRAAVERGAVLLIADFWTEANHIDPPFAALMAGEFLSITGEGDVYSRDEADGLLRASGFQTLEAKPLVGAISLIVAEAV
jgi:hypothetical protein